MVAQYSKWQSEAATLRWQQERKDREARLEAYVT
jgi:heme-degrading monooxygenase HmoA